MHRMRPITPVEKVLTQEKMEVIRMVVESERLLSPSDRSRPPLGDIRSWVVWVACIGGLRTSKRRPLQRNEVPCRGYSRVQSHLELWLATRD